MRPDILSYLEAHRGEFVSGQKLSEELGITRTAVWKHICALRDKGYTIVSYTKRGYCLTEVPELMEIDRLMDEVKTEYMGKNIIYHERVDSTTTLAKPLAAEGAGSGTVVMAEEQTGGRGRLERSFFSPYAKGLWFSLILRPPFPPAEVAKMTLLAAVALTRVFRIEGLANCVIKWPNDILVDGKKLVGILTELNASMEQVDYMILGMGINTSFTEEELPEELRGIATSFRMEGIDVNRNDLWMAVVEELEAYYEKAVNEGFASILEEWKTLSATLGADVEVLLPKGLLAGKAVDIDTDGNLLLATADGVERIVAGDVRVRRKHIVNHKKEK